MATPIETKSKTAPQKTLERRFIPINAVKELRVEPSTDGKPSKLVGYAAVYNALSEDLGGFREFIRPGAFDAAIEECDVRCLIDHDSSRILGRMGAGTLRLTSDAVGLHFEDDLPDTSHGRDIGVSVERRDVAGCSFGFAVVEDDWTVKDGEVFRELVKVHLYDVGPVTFPAYPDTSVATRSFEEFRSKNPAEPAAAPPSLPADSGDPAVDALLRLRLASFC